LDVVKNGADLMVSSRSNVEWYLVRDDKEYGPLSDLDMLDGIDAGDLRPNDHLWRKGFSGWRSAAVVFPELYEVPKPSRDPIEVGEPLVSERSVEGRATSRKTLVFSLFLFVILGGAVSYGYFSSDRLVSEAAIFLARFLHF
jgi:hypothetical protein